MERLMMVVITEWNEILHETFKNNIQKCPLSVVVPMYSKELECCFRTVNSTCERVSVQSFIYLVYQTEQHIFMITFIVPIYV